tara:strand:+ start:1642 stop:2511 length:870 start_codon:yes stop_codon:yes gene_type:complete
VSDKNKFDSSFLPEKLNWSIYTHIKSGDPKVLPNGTAICDKTDIVTSRIVELAHKYNTKVQWGLGFNINPAHPNTTLINNYLSSIGKAANDCNIDGIEVDYEWHNNNWGKIGIIIPELSNRYSHFLKNLKIALGKNKIVSADISGWGVYIFGIYPWVNVTMLNNGDFDFVNTMSYYWSKEGSLYRWQKDIELIKKWGMNPKRVNIGVPYFSMNKTHQPSWKTLSKNCPNININNNSCNNVLFIGKKMNEKIGNLIKKNGFGGVFPWAANYDSIENNNSLIEWLYKGLKN